MDIPQPPSLPSRPRVTRRGTGGKSSIGASAPKGVATITTLPPAHQGQELNILDDIVEVESDEIEEPAGTISTSNKRALIESTGENDSTSVHDVEQSPKRMTAECRREDADTRPFEQWGERLTNFMHAHFNNDYVKFRTDYENKACPPGGPNRDYHSDGRPRLTIANLQRVSRTTTVKTAVFPWRAHENNVVHENDWKLFFKDARAQEQGGIVFDRVNDLTSGQINMIQNFFANDSGVSADIKKHWQDYTRVSTDEWLHTLEKVLLKGRGTDSGFDEFNKLLKQPRTLTPFCTSQIILWSSHLDTQRKISITEEITPAQELILVKSLKEGLKPSGLGQQAQQDLNNLFEDCKRNPSCVNFIQGIRTLCSTWNRVLLATVNQIDLKSLSAWAALEAEKAPTIKEDNNTAITANQVNFNANNPKPGKTPRECYICGKSHTAKCFLLRDWVDPNCRNNEKVPWAQSTIGKAYKKLGWTSARANEYPPGYVIPTTGIIESLYSLMNTNNIHRATVQVKLEQGALRAHIAALLDTGAQSNFISYGLVNRLNITTVKLNNSILNAITTTSTNVVRDAIKVCGALQGQTCTTVNTAVSLSIYHTGVTGLAVLPYNTYFLVGNFEEDLIIGRKTIQIYNLALSYPELFFSWKLEELHRHLENHLAATNDSTKAEKVHELLVEQDTSEIMSRTLSDAVENAIRHSPTKLSRCDCHCQDLVCTEQKGVATHDDILQDREDQTSLLDSAGGLSALGLRNLDGNHQHETLTPPARSNYVDNAYAMEDMWEIPENMLESIPTELLYANVVSQDDVADNIPTKVFGSPEFQTHCNKLLVEFKDIFSREVQTEPAKVSPFKFNVNLSEWHTNRNRSGRRNYDLTRQVALDEIIAKLLRAGIIRTSNASHYSHGFVVPKATAGQWRLVVDYKNLNKVCSTERWPIPDIKQILNRIGHSGAAIFCVMDLTSGYYQAPIDESCKEYTAFMTHLGLYEWNRLPMGPTGACSYFMKTMSTEVFNGLVQLIGELYLDDLIVYGKSESECIDRLRTVFTRCREKHITLHPDKCKFGLSEVEYVGHTIDRDGIHFARSKLDSIKEFPLPTLQSELFSFLGFANYFRDHVENYSSRSCLLYRLTKGYKKGGKKNNKTIIWNDNEIEQFEDIVEAVHNCPKLFFLNEESEIVLCTDASNYGCGAYLYQVCNKSPDNPEGSKHPIAFISKSFDARMRKWSVPEKEGFAIFYALTKLDYLLRDRKFVLKTDHENLTRLKSDQYRTNQKVQRWMLALQHYSFNIEFLPGVENDIADVLSRLCLKLETISFNGLNLESHSTEYDDFVNVHNAILGHMGTAETLRRLKANKAKWAGNMFKKVKSYISQCPICQKNNDRRNLNVAFPFTVSSYKPFEKIQLDFITNIDEDEDGIKNIMVIIDCFSRWVQLYPMKALSAEEAASNIVKFCGSHGIPKLITHDRDSTLVGDTVQLLIQLLGSSAQRTTSYSKEENAIVERANKEVWRHIRNFVFDRAVKTKYSKYIPFVERIMNSSLHKSTGFTPAQILFGNSIDLNRNTILEEHYQSQDITYNQWIAEVIKIQDCIHTLAKTTLTAKDEVHLINYPSNYTDFAIDSYVLVEYKNSFRRGPPSKLLPFLKGPYKVIAKSNGIYQLQDLITLKIKSYHVKRLSAFNFDPSKWDPLECALRDTGDLFKVAKVSGFEGNINGPKKDLRFCVHWVGYKDPTMEPWRNVRNNIHLQNFILNHSDPNVRKLLPKHFKIQEIVQSDSDSEIN